MTGKTTTASSSAESEPTVKRSLGEDGVLEISLNRPRVHNAINAELSSDLLSMCQDAHSDRRVRAVLLRGEGASFSSGQDLKEAASDDHIGRLQEICRCLRSGPPAVAAVHGAAIGGGAEIALACDFVIASQRASFRLPEVELGLAPGGGVTLFLMLALGPTRAARLLLLGEELGAGTALELGLVFSVVDEPQVVAMARDLAKRMVRHDPEAMRRTKDCMRSAWVELYEAAYACEHKAMVDGGTARWGSDGP